MSLIKTYDSVEAMLDDIAKSREAADGRVLPWQDDIKPGMFVVRAWCPTKDPADMLIIYSEIIESEYEEDREQYRQPHMRNFRFTRSYSEVCPDGELGDIHVSSVLDIGSPPILSKEEFEECRTRNWPNDIRVLRSILQSHRCPMNPPTNKS